MRIILITLIVIGIFPLLAEDYYVSPQGSDENPGTLEEPFKTIRYASEVLKPGDRCILREGLYRETIRPSMSGKEGNKITYDSYKGEKVIISSLEQVKGWGKKYGDVYSAHMPWSLGHMNQLFANGKMLNEASWPTVGDELLNPKRAIVMKHGDGSFINTDIPGGNKDWVGAKLWCKGGAGWVCWTGDVTGFDSKTGTVNYEMPGYSGSFYSPQLGNPFVLKGVEAALDDPGEWLYDSDKKELLVIPPKSKKIGQAVIEAKKRLLVIDLTDRSYIDIKGLEFIGGTISTNENSSYLTLDGLKGRYISHSYKDQDCWESGVQINGNNNLVINCDFGYSSGSVLMVKGNDNRVINNYLHHGSYLGLWVGIVDLKGRRQLFSHNTVKYSGRDNVTVSELMESLVQYNDVSDSGYLTNDLGLIYGNNTDFANTVFQYNWLYDNKSPEIAHGFHIDIANYNIIIKNNVIWNVEDAPVSIGLPSQNSIISNNSSLNTGEVTTFGWFESNRQYSARYFSNIFNASMEVRGDIKNNMISGNPAYLNPEKGDFRLKGKKGKNIGAYASYELWKPGCDLENPPNPLPVYSKANIPWMNTIENASFEYGTTEGWVKTGNKTARLVDGNTWGNNWGSEDLHPIATNSYELELGSGKDGIEQTIKNLTPNTKYTLSGWVRTSGSGIRVTMGVKGYGADEKVKSSTSKNWKRKVIKFKTGPNSTTTTLFITKVGADGKAWCDNLLLPLTAH